MNFKTFTYKGFKENGIIPLGKITLKVFFSAIELRYIAKSIR